MDQHGALMQVFSRNNSAINGNSLQKGIAILTVIIAYTAMTCGAPAFSTNDPRADSSALTVSETTLSLRQAGSTSGQSISASEVTFSKATITVPEGLPTPTIPRILLTQRIFPNMDAITLIYEWNPEVKSLAKLRPGQTLVVPSAKTTTGSSIKLSESLLLEIHVDVSLKGQFLQAVHDVDSVAGDNANTAPVLPLETVATMKATIAQLDKIRDAVQENSRPISHVMLIRLFEEVRLLREFAETHSFTGETTNLTPVRRLQLIKEDMSVQVKTLIDVKGSGNVPDSNSKPSIRIRVLKKGSNMEVGGLRIYSVGAYVEGIEAPIPATALYPPISVSVQPGVYSVWASPDNNPNTKLTTSITITLDATTSGPVDIQLLK